MKIKEWFESIKLALSFLTIIPCKPKYSEEILKKSLFFFPVAGLITGSVVFGSAKIIEICGGLNLILYSTILLFAEYCVSNFFHIDGFCDCADALYFTKKGKDKHQILKDPHIGMYAGSLMFFLFAIKTGALFEALQNGYFKILLLYPVCGFIPSFIQPYFMKPMFQEGLGNSLKNIVNKRHIFFSFIFFSITATLIFNLRFAAVFLLCNYLFSFAVSSVIKSKFGGFNGDTIGFGIELVKLFALITGIVIYEI
ncbi:MAG TPA: adenosylcobinamide-GDP ribazoletransferase [bacterium]|nr:adenosylcobinamide-GDP ribazoletransferase [bacterium]HPN31550.1 adenosylcobinamide-GDP ribazoletransferase [bacterium]